MRYLLGLLISCVTSVPLAAFAQIYEFGTVAKVAADAVDNDEVVYNHPHLRLNGDMATLSAAHILQHDLQPVTPHQNLLREQIKIELYRRQLFNDDPQRRQLMAPYFTRMEVEVANGLVEANKWPDAETAQRLGEVSGRIFQHLTEGIQKTLAATGGPTQMGAISSTFANAPLRLSMVPARQFEIATASSWLLERAIRGDIDDGWEVMRNDQEVRLQGVYTIRVKRDGWYDYYKLTLGSGDPKFERRPPASLVPELVLQPFETMEKLAQQIVRDELVEMFTPRFDFREEPQRAFVYSLGNSMLESQGPEFDFQAFDSLVRVEMIRQERVTTPSREAFWNPILRDATRVIRDEVAYLRSHGVMTREKEIEFRDRTENVYITALKAYARRKGYEAYREEVKGVKRFTILFETRLPAVQEIYYIPATVKIFADILRRPVPQFKWQRAYTGKSVQLSAGNYFWSKTRSIDGAEPFSEVDNSILVDLVSTIVDDTP